MLIIIMNTNVAKGKKYIVENETLKNLEKVSQKNSQRFDGWCIHAAGGVYAAAGGQLI